MFLLKTRKFMTNKITFKKTFASVEQLFTNKDVQEYKDNGYLVIPKLFSASLIEDLKKEVNSVIERVNLNEISSLFDPEHLKSDRYFIESGDKVIK